MDRDRLKIVLAFKHYYIRILLLSTPGSVIKFIAFKLEFIKTVSKLLQITWTNGQGAELTTDTLPDNYKFDDEKLTLTINVCFIMLLSVLE